MIIKSLSRRTQSYESLYNYLTRDREAILNSFNLYSNPHNRRETIKEFLENAEFLKRARGKNYLYHEIISLNKNNLSLEQQIQILQDIVSKYVSLRANKHLIFTALHKDKEHTHIHLMISANELMGEKRIRLSKKEFNTIQKELEQYVNTTYPGLGSTKHYQQSKDLEKSKNKEQETKRRTKKTSKKEELRNELKDLFEKATTKTYLKNYCLNRELEFYIRGKTTGVIFEGKKYRLKTLGLEKEYNQLLKRLEKQQERKEKREQAQSNGSDTKINSRREEMRKARESKTTDSRFKE